MLTHPVTVLIAPLDWGLGHATRCYPIIQEIDRMGHEVILGISGSSGKWLANEFPHLRTVQIPSYHMRYDERLPAWLSIAMQIKPFIRSIHFEKKWLNSFIQNQKIDLIISDNRYGLHHAQIKSILITHQLHIPSRIFSLFNILARRINHRFLSAFNEVWIPDSPEINGLSGKLAHPPLKGIKTTYLGPLSRFYDNDINPVNTKTYRYCFIISGPEPKRSKFENICLYIAKKTNLPCLIIRGTDKTRAITSSPHITVIDIAGTEELLKYINQSSIVISRSGYSSIMDWVCIGAEAILVPTPGQPEQIYLAEYLHQQDMFTGISEKELMNQGLPTMINRRKRTFNFHSFKQTLNKCLS